VVYAEREFVPPQVRAFVDAVVVWAERELADGFHPTRVPVCGAAKGAARNTSKHANKHATTAPKTTSRKGRGG
jgi:hypothetical protein